jgi:hypothetical protein
LSLVITPDFFSILIILSYLLACSISYLSISI